MTKNRTLVVVDMQNDFIDGALKNDAAKAIVPGIVDLIKSGGFDDILYTKDTHNEDYLDTIEGKNLSVVHCIKETDGWRLNKEISDAMYAMVDDVESIEGVEKETFGSYDLPKHIASSTEEIVFVGTCTGICVINNVAVVKAFFPNTPITVYEDLCACVTPESHARAIEQMRFNHINIKKWSE